MTRRNFPASRFLRIATLSAALLLTLALGFSPLLEAQSTGAATLTVHVIGARNTKGKIRAALFREPTVSQTTHRGPSTHKRLTLTRKHRVRKSCSRIFPRASTPCRCSMTRT